MIVTLVVLLSIVLMVGSATTYRSGFGVASAVPPVVILSTLILTIVLGALPFPAITGSFPILPLPPPEIVITVLMGIITTVAGAVAYLYNDMSKRSIADDRRILEQIEQQATISERVNALSVSFPEKRKELNRTRDQITTIETRNPIPVTIMDDRPRSGVPPKCPTPQTCDAPFCACFARPAVSVTNTVLRDATLSIGGQTVGTVESGMLSWRAPNGPCPHCRHIPGPRDRYCEDCGTELPAH